MSQKQGPGQIADVKASGFRTINDYREIFFFFFVIGGEVNNSVNVELFILQRKLWPFEINKYKIRYCDGCDA